MEIAAGVGISTKERYYLRWRRRMYSNEDSFFTSWQLRDRLGKIEQQGKKLPDTYSYAGLKRASEKEAKKNTKGNPFGIRAGFYKKRLNAKLLKKLKGSQKKFNYVESPEYSDLELLLNQFAKDKTQVLFIIPPVNAKWQKYTGLSQKMYDMAVTKIKHQLVSQGFGNVYDLSKDGKKKYFMEDTIHLGWNGWLAVDQAVRPFMKQKYVKPIYALSDYYFTNSWRKKKKLPKTALKNKDVLAKLKK
ncbi:hypothetical protein lacNasYZ03_14790 [Lactobacillus nasalidis]|uniref:D-alanyl-lipoteichoic acid biosynthesis protein DltD n=3 Tax=Lactobacillus nasalidis TaxID=2797258 RepID=A0ABQ3WC37_9LACO|nr:hypothetical protein lacNasYZ03_14790 [Lactobacillus nasalidis]